MADGHKAESNIGTYLARRLINIGVKDYFAVPGTWMGFVCVWHARVAGWLAGWQDQTRLTDRFSGGAIPGDYNLVLLDQLLKFQPDLRLISCCNELDAGYAADGYARAQGVAAMVVTFTVGGLSAINAVAGAYSDGAFPFRVCL